MSTIKTKGFMDDFRKVMAKEMGIVFKAQKNGTQLATINLSALKISILKINGRSVTIQVIYEYQGKPIIELREAELREGSCYTMVATDSFKIKTKIIVT